MLGKFPEVFRASTGSSVTSPGSLLWMMSSTPHFEQILNLLLGPFYFTLPLVHLPILVFVYFVFFFKGRQILSICQKQCARKLNIVQSHHSVRLDWQQTTEYFAEDRQFRRRVLWLWIMVWTTCKKREPSVHKVDGSSSGYVNKMSPTSPIGCETRNLVWDGWQIQIKVVATFFINFGVHMNVLVKFKVKVFLLIKWS